MMVSCIPKFWQIIAHYLVPKHVLRDILDTLFYIERGRILNPRGPPWSRAYPRGFGENRRDAWEYHLESEPGRRDLRFKPQTFKPLSLRAQLDNMMMGNLWENAQLWDAFEFMWNSAGGGINVPYLPPTM